MAPTPTDVDRSVNPISTRPNHYWPPHIFGPSAASVSEGCGVIKVYRQSCTPQEARGKKMVFCYQNCSDCSDCTVRKNCSSDQEKECFVNLFLDVSHT